MRLRTRLQVIGAATAIFGVAIVLVVAFASAGFRDAIDQLALAEQLERTAADLVIITQEYAMHGHERARVQWQARHEMLREVLTRIGGFEGEAAAEAERLRGHVDSLRELFELLVERRGTEATAGDTLARARALLAGQLLVESYSVTDAASALARLTMDAIKARERKASRIVTGLVATLALAVLLATLLAWRGVGGAFARLHEGARRVAGGDLSVRVGPGDGVARDEFSELALAIDASTRAQALQRRLLALSHRQVMAANASRSVAEAMKSTVDAVCEFTGWPVGHALLQPHPGAPIVSSRIWSIPEDARFAEVRAITEPLRYDDDHIGVVASVVQSRKLRYVPQISSATNPIRCKAFERVGIRGHVALPVLLGNEVAAVLEFFVTAGVEPEDELLATLEQIGVQLGRVIERSRAQQALSDETRRRDRSLLALSARIAAAANEAESPADGYERTLRDVCAFTCWPVGHVLRREHDRLVSTSAWYLDDDQRYRALREADEGRELEALGCLAQVLEEGRPVVVARVSEQSDPARCAALRASDLYGHVLLPVLVEREVVAVMEFMSREAMEPDRALLEVLTHAGVQLGRVVERARAREALSQRAAELARSNAELESFAYVASHDLQEPLRMVASYAQLLERRYAAQLDENARRFLGYAVEGATRMQALVNGLLQISRVGADEEPPRAVDMGALMAPLRRQMEQSIAESGGELVVGQLPVVRGNPEQIAQVLQNLVGNALKFRRPEVPPRVEVSAERRDEMWCISVRDNGIGMDMKHAARVFQIFQRLHSRTSYLGTGIGLTLCKKLVERHGGHIWFESSPGEGTTFHFTLPALDP